jgi:hypothetical protein
LESIIVEVKKKKKNFFEIKKIFLPPRAFHCVDVAAAKLWEITRPNSTEISSVNMYESSDPPEKFEEFSWRELRWRMIRYRREKEPNFPMHTGQLYFIWGWTFSSVLDTERWKKVKKKKKKNFGEKKKFRLPELIQIDIIGKKLWKNILIAPKNLKLKMTIIILK